jgi:hypothetical protein
MQSCLAHPIHTTERLLTLVHASLQLLDLPGIIEGAAQGKGELRAALFDAKKPEWQMVGCVNCADRLTVFALIFCRQRAAGHRSMQKCRCIAHGAFPQDSCERLAALLTLVCCSFAMPHHALKASCPVSQVLDASKPTGHKEILTRELESVGIRLNRDPPNIFFKCACCKQHARPFCLVYTACLVASMLIQVTGLEG